MEQASAHSADSHCATSSAGPLQTAAASSVEPAADTTSEPLANSQPLDTAQLLVGLITKRLQALGYSALRKIDVNIEQDTIQLSGRVPRYYHRQLVEVTVMKLASGYYIDSRIEVA